MAEAWRNARDFSHARVRDAGAAIENERVKHGACRQGTQPVVCHLLAAAQIQQAQAAAALARHSQESIFLQLERARGEVKASSQL